MFKKKKWLIAPVEIKARSFESRLLLAVHAAQKGYGVIFGSQRQILHYFGQLPKGIYFDKSISKNKYDLLKKMTDKGFKLTCIDEEGFPHHMKGYMYLKQRVSKETLGLTTKFFAWGEEERDFILEHFPDRKGKIIATGNPRFDLWRKEFRKVHANQAEEYKKKYGNYILVPSNFSTTHVEGEKFMRQQLKDQKLMENEKEEEIINDYIELEHKIIEGFKKVIKALAEKFPDHTIIVRPHPVENFDFWRKAAKGAKNVEVIHEGVITPWILGAKMLVHSSCTTGLEAFLMGIPAITFLPFGENEIRTHLSDKVSFRAESPEEVAELAKGVFDGKILKKNLDELKNHFSSLKGEFAFEKIRKEFDGIDLKPAVFKKIDWLKLKIKKMVYHPKLSQYAAQKFPNTKLKEVKELIKKYIECGGFKEPRVKELDKNIYAIWL